MMSRHRQTGFTLVEIVIVVAIIGLLAVLGSLMVTKSHNKALIKQAEVDVRKLSVAILQMAWDTGKWPNGGARDRGGNAELWNLSILTEENPAGFDNWRGPYYEDDLEDPWGNDYFFDPDYRSNGTDRIVVGSFGPNGIGKNVYDADNIFVLLDD